jgi:hypothetical protein
MAMIPPHKKVTLWTKNYHLLNINSAAACSAPENLHLNKNFHVFGEQCMTAQNSPGETPYFTLCGMQKWDFLIIKVLFQPRNPHLPDTTCTCTPHSRKIQH